MSGMLLDAVRATDSADAGSMMHGIAEHALAPHSEARFPVPHAIPRPCASALTAIGTSCSSMRMSGLLASPGACGGCAAGTGAASGCAAMHHFFDAMHVMSRLLRVEPATPHKKLPPSLALIVPTLPLSSSACGSVATLLRTDASLATNAADADARFRVRRGCAAAASRPPAALPPRSSDARSASTLFPRHRPCLRSPRPFSPSAVPSFAPFPPCSIGVSDRDRCSRNAAAGLSPRSSTVVPPPGDASPNDKSVHVVSPTHPMSCATLGGFTDTARSFTLADIVNDSTLSDDSNARTRTGPTTLEDRRWLVGGLPAALTTVGPT